MSNTTMRRCSSRTVRVRDLVALIAAAAGATLGTMACSSSSSTAPKTGSLAVTIAAPAGMTPSVAVSGPAGYHQTLTSTQTLSGLAAGSYTVSAAAVTVANPIVAALYAGTSAGSPATVMAGATAAATVTYAQQPGTGGLWVGNGNAATVLEYSATQLGATTSASPITALGTGAANTGVAFDASGNMWVVEFSLNAVAQYSAAQLASSGGPTPVVTLNAGSGSMNSPAGLAFDGSGNLWVSKNNANALVEYTASQLTASGSPTPAVTVTTTGGSLNQPIFMAFDRTGDLWVANDAAPTGTIVEFTPAQLTASGSPTPAVTLSDTLGAWGRAPAGLAFDASGNLWVASFGDSIVVEFTPGQLAASGSPTPAAMLSSVSRSLAGPVGLAFDASGDLWIANLASSTVVELAANQLATSGTALPSVTVSGGAIVKPFAIAFDPHAGNLPLKP